jgi:hypothetical protein
MSGGKKLKGQHWKDKVMCGGDGTGNLKQKGRYPCGVCGNGVASNSPECIGCHKWVHKRYTNIDGSLQAASAAFRCRKCMAGIQSVGA